LSKKIAALSSKIEKELATTVGFDKIRQIDAAAQTSRFLGALASEQRRNLEPFFGAL
jgi:hypothetical protein